MTQIHLLPAGVEAHYNVQVPMRDGVHLSTDIYFPKSQSGPFPGDTLPDTLQQHG